MFLLIFPRLFLKIHCFFNRIQYVLGGFMTSMISCRDQRKGLVWISQPVSRPQGGGGAAPAGVPAAVPADVPADVPTDVPAGVLATALLSNQRPPQATTGPQRGGVP